MVKWAVNRNGLTGFSLKKIRSPFENCEGDDAENRCFLLFLVVLLYFSSNIPLSQWADCAEYIDKKFVRIVTSADKDWILPHLLGNLEGEIEV